MTPVRKIWIISIIVSLAGLAVIFRIVDFGLVANRLADANLYFIGLCLLLYLCVCLCRAGRLWLLLGALHPVSPLACLRLTLAHQAIFAVAPSGSGDLAFPVLGRMITKTKLRDIIPVLISFRLQDIAMLIALGGFGLTVILLSPVTAGLYATGLFFLIGGFILILLSARAGSRIRFLLWYIRHKFARIGRAGETAPPPLKGEVPLFRTIFLTALMTLVSWAFAGGMIWAAFRAYNMSLDWQLVPYLVAGLNLVGALAFTTIGGLGVSELGLAGLLIAASVPAETAVPVAMIVRPTLLIITVLFGLFALAGSFSPDRNPE